MAGSEQEDDEKESKKWYQNAAVHAATIGGCFALLIALIPRLIDCSEPREVAERSHAEEIVKSHRTSALLIKSRYERIEDPHSVTDRDVVEVRKHAPSVGNQLLRISDDNIDVNFQIVKYGYAGMLYTNVGQLETNTKQIKIYADLAEKALDNCMERIEEVESKATGSDEYYSTLLGWINDEDVKHWVKYNQAIVAALQAKTGSGTRSWEVVGQHLETLPPVYIEEFPTGRNPTLTWACQELSGAESSNLCGNVLNE